MPRSAIERHKDKIRTRSRRLLAKGKIVRTACELCGNPNAEMHHPDYRDERVVAWLCHSCHMTGHSLRQHPRRFLDKLDALEEFLS